MHTQIPASETEARNILNTHFFGIDEAISYLGVFPTDNQLASLSRIPFSASALRARAHSHMLAAVLPMPVIELKKRLGPKVFSRLELEKCPTEAFYESVGTPQWKLLLIGGLAGTKKLTYREQQRRANEAGGIPSLHSVVYAATGYLLLNPMTPIFGDTWVRCSDTAISGGHTTVGCSTEGLTIVTDEGLERHPSIAAAFEERSDLD